MHAKKRCSASRSYWACYEEYFDHAPIEDHNRMVYKKLDFMFEDATLDIDQQLLTEEGQWIFTIKDEKYYLPSSKQHFPLSFFQSVMEPRKMK